MASNIGDPLSNIKSDIESKLNAATKEIAEEVTFQIEKAYETVVESFYNEYTPRSYDRLFATYWGSTRFDDEFGVDPAGEDFIAGIEVDPSNINKHYETDGVGKRKKTGGSGPYRADTDWVFRRTYLEGIHGFFRVEYQEWVENRVKTHKWSKAKTLREKKLAAKTLKHAPKKSKSPETAMERMFNEILKKKSLDAIRDDVLGRYFP